MTRSAQRMRALVLALMSVLGLPSAPIAADEWTVGGAAASPSLAEAVANASPGDRIIIEGGIHPGPLTIDKSLELVGRGWPEIRGDGRGTVIVVTSPEVRVSGLVVRGSGSSLDRENSGITVDGGSGSVIAGNRFEDVLFGVYLRKSPGSAITDNEIEGKLLAVPRRGDAIRVWYSDDVRIENNRVSESRDVVLWYSKRLVVRGNSVSGGRYGLHFMYCDDASIEENLLEGNSVGAFLMYSRRLRLIRNTIVGNHGPSGFGIGLKDMDDALLLRNRFVGNRIGVFLDNSPRESGSAIEVRENLIAGNDVGVSLLPNVMRGRFLDNSLVENQQQVEIAGRGADPEDNLWAGNFWSDYAGYDSDGDGVGEVDYRADRLFEDLADRRPELRLFLYSPAKDALELAARTMPLVAPRAKIIDATPAMAPTEPEGCPEIERPGRAGFGRLGGGLVLLAGVVLLAPGSLSRRSRRATRARDEGGASAARVGEAAASPLIRVRGLSKHFGRQVALDNVSFDVEAGEAVAVWGPNGAGKTTLLRVLLGVIPSVGEVRVAGSDPWKRGKEARARIGFVPQEVSLQRELRVEETLAFFAALRRAPTARIPGLLADLGLEGELEKRVGQLSGGQRQRLALALSLLSDPPILVLDEPTANLDARARADFIALLRGLRSSGRTLIFSSHRPEEVHAVADRVLHLDAGRLIEDETPSVAALDGDRAAELWLRVASDEAEAAATVIESIGLPCRHLGAHLVVEVAAGRKLEPIRELLSRGIRLESFEVDVANGSGGRDAE